MAEAHERPLLLDAKTLFAGGGIYRTPSARDDQSGAVEERARQVPREYLAHAARLDTRFHGAGSTLIRDRIASFGPTRGVIFGNYREASRMCTRSCMSLTCLCYASGTPALALHGRTR